MSPPDLKMQEVADALIHFHSLPSHAKDEAVHTALKKQILLTAPTGDNAWDFLDARGLPDGRALDSYRKMEKAVKEGPHAYPERPIEAVYSMSYRVYEATLLRGQVKHDCIETLKSIKPQISSAGGLGGLRKVQKTLDQPDPSRTMHVADAIMSAIREGHEETLGALKDLKCDFSKVGAHVNMMGEFHNPKGIAKVLTWLQEQGVVFDKKAMAPAVRAGDLGLLETIVAKEKLSMTELDHCLEEACTAGKKDVCEYLHGLGARTGRNGRNGEPRINEIAMRRGADPKDFTFKSVIPWTDYGPDGHRPASDDPA